MVIGRIVISGIECVVFVFGSVIGGRFRCLFYAARFGAAGRRARPAASASRRAHDRRVIGIRICIVINIVLIRIDIIIIRIVLFLLCPPAAAPTAATRVGSRVESCAAGFARVGAPGAGRAVGAAQTATRRQQSW